MLGLAGAGAAGLVLGGGAMPAHADTARPPHTDTAAGNCAEDFPTDLVVPFHGDLVSRNELWDQPTFYGGSRFTGAYDAAFYHRVEYFLEDFYYLVPQDWRPEMRINVLGVHVDKANSWHMYGRAIDFASITMIDIDGGNRFAAFEARVDSWGTARAYDIDRIRYWSTIAAMNYRSADVLHHRYNAEHRNHVHMDNGRSGTATSTTFNSGSPVLIRTIQSCLTYIWGLSVSIDGAWGSQTSGAVSTALSRIGRSGSLTSAANWKAFLHNSTWYGTRGGYSSSIAPAPETRPDKPL